MQRNNFNKGIKLHLLCDLSDIFQPFKKYIYFKDGYAYTSEGHILVKAYLPEISSFNEDDIHSMDGKFLHADNYKLLIKYDVVSVSVNGFTVRKGDASLIIPFESEEIVPMPYNEEWENNARCHITSIHINPFLLLTLANAMGSNDINVEFSDANVSPYRVIFYDKREKYVKTKAFFMPKFAVE